MHATKRQPSQISGGMSDRAKHRICVAPLHQQHNLLHWHLLYDVAVWQQITCLWSQEMARLLKCCGFWNEGSTGLMQWQLGRRDGWWVTQHTSCYSAAIRPATCPASLDASPTWEGTMVSEHVPSHTNVNACGHNSRAWWRHHPDTCHLSGLPLWAPIGQGSRPLMGAFGWGRWPVGHSTTE